LSFYFLFKNYQLSRKTKLFKFFFEILFEDMKKEKTKIKVKSQAAMEYLMTYVRAILIISLALGVLYSLGVLNPKNFLPRVPPGSCFVFRPNGPGTTDMLSLQGTCGYLPMYVASFNGVDGYVKVPTFDDGGIEMTIIMWVYDRTPLGSNAGQPLLWGYPYSAEGRGIEIYSGYGGNTYGVMTSYNQFNDYAIPRRPNEWHQIAVVVSKSGLFWNAYKDGRLTYRKNISNFDPSNADLYIDGNKLFNGLIANVQVYNTALSQQELQYLYQQGLGGGPIHLQNLVAWWPLNGDAKDYSGNNNHGSIGGGVSFIQNYNPP
jgi:hypothetical protein